MSDWSNESAWPIDWREETSQCLVLNEDTRTVVSEFPGYGAAYAWIMDTHDHQENIGLPKANYSVIPVRARPDGRDTR